MKRGFTILELLVASLLLSMLVTILTMIFNQSSIAWRTGIASVNDMETTRRQMGGYHDIMDDALPGVGEDSSSHSAGSDNRLIRYRTVSVFKGWQGGQNVLGAGVANAHRQDNNCKARLFDQIVWNAKDASQFSVQQAMRGETITDLNQPIDSASKGGYIVGVRSAGPNRQMDDEDDITTYPEEID